LHGLVDGVEPLWAIQSDNDDAFARAVEFQRV
jgi:hypothetical protein